MKSYRQLEFSASNRNLYDAKSRDNVTSEQARDVRPKKVLVNSKVPLDLLNQYDETRTTGSMSINVYRTYLTNALGLIAPITLLILFSASQALLLSADYWVFNWYFNWRKKLVPVQNLI
jgi:hypothetical protein